MGTVTIEVVSDVLCPGCFRPFFLDPSIPEAGLDRTEYMRAKFGEERLKTIHDPLIAAGKEDGVPYQFDKITRTPNTLNAHRLLRWAYIAGVQREVHEALFMAYWSWGQDIGDLEVLKTIAIVNGLNGDDVAKNLKTDLHKREVLEEVLGSQQMGVQGVPTFVFNKKYGLVGAQPTEAIVETIRKVAAEA